MFFRCMIGHLRVGHQKLTQVEGEPNNGYQYGFIMPGNRIGPPLKVLQCAGSNPVILREFMLENGYLFANVSDVWAQFKTVIDCKLWDAGFVTAFVYALASSLAVPLQQDEKLRDDLAFYSLW
ncbi:MAG: hypothetical protein U5K75_00085 [Ahrensia sp.]|nr:hypothetical protein [Ahrensia sp.]